jgi:ABC-type nickel/cobalt efflux system permease component RcnA
MLKKIITLTALFAMMGLSTRQLEAVTYVTDTGGYAYDESRAVTNLAPAIALGTVAIVGIIAIAVQNSHESSSSSAHLSPKHHRHHHHHHHHHGHH